jgi:GDP-L-fucose synthase
MKKNRRIFFTGGKGFIGREIIPLFRQDGYDVIDPSSKELDLMDSDAVKKFIENDNFDIIIHAAMCSGTGRYGKPDGLDVLYKNIRMFENVFRYADEVDSFINLDSGASLFNLSKIPDDSYGFSKYCIARSINRSDNGINVRMYACFGSKEDTSRFLAVNIRNYIEKKPIKIFKNRQMDFMYVKDVYKNIKYALDNNIKDINCVYDKKYCLTDIADIINSLDNYNIDVIIENEGMDPPYCIDMTQPVKLDYIGLEQGIKECYEDYLR